MVEISSSGSGEGPGWGTGPGYSTTASDHFDSTARAALRSPFSTTTASFVGAASEL